MYMYIDTYNSYIYMSWMRTSFEKYIWERDEIMKREKDQIYKEDGREGWYDIYRENRIDR